MRGSEYFELAAFVAVVDHGSFARAAKHLRIAPSSLSQTIKKLEGRAGVQLLHRTTRSVAMTGAGSRLFERFRPAMQEMDAALSDVRDSGATPAGLVRLHLPRAAFASLLEGRLGELQAMHPRIRLDAVIDDALIDIVRAGFDLDVRLFSALDPSTCSRPTQGTLRHVAVASPTYFKANGTPATPSELAHHRCIQWRRPGTEHPYRWSFQIDGCTSLIDVDGPLTVSHCDLAVAAAIDSVGIAFVLERYATVALHQKLLKPVLSKFLPPFRGWCVCHPRASQPSAATSAVLDFIVQGA